jgi:ATP-dependent DNA helicase RecG
VQTQRDGSGVKNLYKYTKLYSGGVPELIDGDVFKTIVPLNKSNYVLSDKMPVSDKMSDNVSVNAPQQKILSHIETHGEINTTVAAGLIDRSPGTARRVLSHLVDAGVIVAIGANRNRRYKISE